MARTGRPISEHPDSFLCVTTITEDSGNGHLHISGGLLTRQKWVPACRLSLPAATQRHPGDDTLPDFLQ